MKIILTEEVQNLGQAGDVVNVRDGYGRNFLLPRGKAMLATDSRVKELDHKRRVIEEKTRKEMATWEAVRKNLDGTELEFTRQTGDEGKLFGSVTSADIFEQLTEKGFEIDRRRIQLKDPIKAVGSSMVTVKLHAQVAADVKVIVLPAEGGGPEAQVEEEEAAAPAVAEAVGSGEWEEE